MNARPDAVEAPAAGASLDTGFTSSGETPADVIVQSFAADLGVIDATGAAARPDVGTDESGSIRLTVTGSTPMQPKTVALVLPGTRKRPQLKLRGWVDLGPGAGALEGPATFVVGTRWLFPTRRRSRREPEPSETLEG